MGRTHEVTRHYSGDVEAALDVARTILLDDGFTVERRGPHELVATAPGRLRAGQRRRSAVPFVTEARVAVPAGCVRVSAHFRRDSVLALVGMLTLGAAVMAAALAWLAACDPHLVTEWRLWWISSLTVVLFTLFAIGTWRACVASWRTGLAALATNTATAAWPPPEQVEPPPADSFRRYDLTATAPLHAPPEEAIAEARRWALSAPLAIEHLSRDRLFATRCGNGVILEYWLRALLVDVAGTDIRVRVARHHHARVIPLVLIGLGLVPVAQVFSNGLHGAAVSERVAWLTISLVPLAFVALMAYVLAWRLPRSMVERLARRWAWGAAGPPLEVVARRGPTVALSLLLAVPVLGATAVALEVMRDAARHGHALTPLQGVGIGMGVLIGIGIVALVTGVVRVRRIRKAD